MLWLLFDSFALLCVLRVPIAFAMLISSTLAIAVQGDVPLSIVPQRMWVGLNNFPLLAVPYCVRRRARPRSSVISSAGSGAAEQ
jgi:hypothetical protein